MYIGFLCTYYEEEKYDCSKLKDDDQHGYFKKLCVNNHCKNVENWLETRLNSKE